MDPNHFHRALDSIFSRQLRDPETMGGMRMRVEAAFAEALAAERTATGGEEPSVADTEAAREILTYLGHSQEPSLEPGDRRRDRVAAIIAARVAPAVPAPDKAQEEWKNEPKQIWLEPGDADFGEYGRTWCEDDAWDEPGVPYIRLDLHEAQLSTAHASGREEGERAMREAAAKVADGTAREYGVHKGSADGFNVVTARIRGIPVPLPAQEAS